MSLVFNYNSCTNNGCKQITFKNSIRSRMAQLTFTKLFNKKKIIYLGYIIIQLLNFIHEMFVYHLIRYRQSSLRYRLMKRTFLFIP